MKLKVYTKRTMSLILCVVMLVSCWVFSAPVANAADTWYDGNSAVYGNNTPTSGTTAPTSNWNGKYRVRILLREVKQMDTTIHDNKDYVSGLTYGTSTSDSKRNLSGGMSLTSFNDYTDDKGTNKEYWCEYAQIKYRTMNGTSSGSVGYCWFNMGDKTADSGYDDTISGGGEDYGYYPSKEGVVLDGFPIECITRYVTIEKNGWFDSTHDLQYKVYLQVARWTDSGTYVWTDMGGTCDSMSGLFSGGWSGTEYGVASGSYTGKSIKGKAVENKITMKFGDTNADGTEDNSYYMPYACSAPASGTAYTSSNSTTTVKLTSGSSSTTAISNLNCPATSSTAAKSCYVYFTSPRDQYGAYMAANIKIQATNSDKKTKFLFKTGDSRTITVPYDCNIDGTTDEQKIKATVTWPQTQNKSNYAQVSGTSGELTVNDASYTVSFKSEDGSVTYTNNQSSFQYGHTPAYNGTTPTKTDSANPPVYKYTHDGWSSTVGGDELTSLPAVTGVSDKTFYAYFTSEKIPYTVVFKDNNGTELSSADYYIGDTITPPEDPEDYQTVDKNYTFDKWVGTNSEVYDGNCHGAITYIPSYTESDREYTVTFKNHDGVVLGTKDFKWHEQIIVPDSINPTKTADGQEYSAWTFTGWSPAIDANTIVTGEGMEFTAQFEGTKVPYTVRFVDDAGKDYIDPQTLYWGDTPTVPQNVTKTSTEQYSYTFTGWSPEVTDVNGSVIYTAQFEPTLRKYTITYLDSDGNVYKVVENVAYGTVPAEMTGEDAVPELITRPSNAINHYTASWDNDINKAIEGDITFRIVDTPEAHEAYLGEATVTKEATCMETGLEEQTCSVCNYVVKTEIPINSNAHSWQRWEDCDEKNISGLDDIISVIFECENGCGNYCASSYDPQTQEYKPNPGDENENVSTTRDSKKIVDTSPTIKTPSFNEHEEFFDGQDQPPYSYNERKASLRVRSSEKGTDTQAMRFSGNLYATKIFNTVSFDVNPNRIFNNSQLMSLDDIRAKNAADKAAIAAGETVEDVYDDTILDFGFVFTQARFIRTAKTVIDYDLMTLDNIGTDYRIYRMSVVGNNLANYNQSKSMDNWKGLTVCDDGDLTFNLVIDVNEKNYQATYVARTYVIYKYHGDIICVYDQPIEHYDFDEETWEEIPNHYYSHDSVYNQAHKVLTLTEPTDFVRSYLEDKIINNTATQNFNDSKGDKKVNYTLKDFPKQEEY